MPNFSIRTLLLIVLGAALLAGWVAISARRQNALVVYCAHDLVFAESILNDFEKETGIKLVIVGDTEATKSLGLVQRLLREKDHPVCDVFWNNQALGTMQLAEADVLQSYKGSGYKRIPDRYKDSQGRWVGFAGRLRVWIANTEKTSHTEESLSNVFDEQDLSRAAIAKPLYGTTLSHYSLLWHQWGGDELKRWHHSVVSRGLQVVQGNATVKNLVAEGVCDLGWTDTDDFFVGLDDGRPVQMFPIRVGGKTICIPNSVAIIKGTQRRANAEKLVDFLLSKETELKLAHSQARQIPLGDVDTEELPEDVRPLANWAQDSVEITGLAESRQRCLNWLLEEYAP